MTKEDSGPESIRSWIKAANMSIAIKDKDAGLRGDRITRRAVLSSKDANHTRPKQCT